MSRPGLASLIAPVKVDAFFRSHWPKEPLHVPSSRGKLRAILNLPELQDIESMLKTPQVTIRASLPDYNDEYSSVIADAKDAMKLFRNGMGLSVSGLHVQQPVLMQWLEALRSDLGMASGDGKDDLAAPRTIAYATAKGKGTGAHYDLNANFAVQLRGRKRWTLAPNTSVENPSTRHTIGAPVPPELKAECHSALPGKMPKKSVSVVLDPGSVLYVPRGYWHSTHAESDSLSITFTFCQPTWASVFTAALKTRLSKDPRWRELADGLESHDRRRRTRALAIYSELLEDFAGTASSLQAETLTGKGPEFIKVPKVSVKFRGDRAVFSTKSAAGLQIESNTEMKSLLRWIAGSNRAFGVMEAARFLKNGSVPACAFFLSQLEEAGFIRRV